MSWAQSDSYDSFDNDALRLRVTPPVIEHLIDPTISARVEVKMSERPCAFPLVNVQICLFEGPNLALREKLDLPTRRSPTAALRRAHEIVVVGGHGERGHHNVPGMLVNGQDGDTLGRLGPQRVADLIRQRPEQAAAA